MLELNKIYQEDCLKIMKGGLNMTNELTINGKV